MSKDPNPRVVLTFVRYAISELIQFGRHVVTSLTGNVNFATPSPSLVVVSAVVDQLEAADEAAMNGDRLAISARKDAKAAVITDLRALAAYVQNQGDSDRTTLLTSGFNLARVPAPIGELPPPDAPVVVHGTGDGEIKGRITRPNGCTSVNWRIAVQSAPTVYLQTPSTSGGRYTFKSLMAGEIYLVQAAVVGKFGASNWGPTSALMAL
jgi:hypothetical protein